MKPIKFPYSNAVFAKNQPEYIPLPAYTDGTNVISCWSLSFKERMIALWSGQLWIRQLTFGQKLQAIRPQVQDPFPKMEIAPREDVSRVQNAAD